MSITFDCLKCGKQNTAEDAVAGGTVPCSSCGAEIKVPEAPALGRPAAPVRPEAPQPPPPPQVVVVQAPAPVQYATAPVVAWTPAQRELAKRRRHLILIGIVLLVAFFLPTLGLDAKGDLTAGYPAFKALGDTTGAFSGVAKTLILWGPLAGVVTILLAAALKYRARGVILLLLPIVPIFIAMGQKSVAGNVYLTDFRNSGLVRWWSPGGKMLCVFVLLAMLLLIVGASSRRYRPQWGMLLYWIALAGVVCFLLAILLPIGPKGGKEMPIRALIRALSQKPSLSTVSGFMDFARPVGVAASIALFALASVLCVFTFPGIPRGAAGGLSRGACLLLFFGMLVFVLTVYFLGLVRIADANGAPGLFVWLTYWLKVVLGLGGLLLLVPAGLIDALIGPPPKSAPA